MPALEKRRAPANNGVSFSPRNQNTQIPRGRRIKFLRPLNSSTKSSHTLTKRFESRPKRERGIQPITQIKRNLQNNEKSTKPKTSRRRATISREERHQETSRGHEMFCIRNIPRNCISPVRFISKAKYSRRSDKNTSSYKVVQSRDDALDEFDNQCFGVDPNWELLTPRGFRFYLPGSVGPGWLNSSTTAHVEVRSVTVSNDLDSFKLFENDEKKKEEVFSVLHCTAQECPALLRKGILELFPNCLEVTSPQLTIVTISQKSKNGKKTRWSREIETEKLAQYFVLAASDVCKKLKMCGYWADFINPFSGQPYLNPHKNSTLYKTDERFRCVGFKIEHKTNCKVISSDNDAKQFIGNLYTTAPSSTDFLKEIMNDMNSKLD